PQARAGRGAPALDRTAGLPNSEKESNPPNNANGDLRSKPAAGSRDPRRAQADSEAWQKLRSLEGHSKALISVRISPNSKTAATVSYDDSLRFWDIATGAMNARYDFEAGTVGCDFSP